MAGPLSGVGGQQIPAANTFRPGESGRQQEEVRNSEQTDELNSTREPEEAENVLASQREESVRSSNESEAQNSGNQRGSLVDITV